MGRQSLGVGGRVQEGVGLAVFLSDAQVRRLTGTSDKQAAARWLAANGIRHWINAAGKIIVPASAVDQGAPSPTGGWSPDFSRLTGA